MKKPLRFEILEVSAAQNAQQPILEGATNFSNPQFPKEN
jgi:hypothetical protein